MCIEILNFKFASETQIVFNYGNSHNIIEICILICLVLFRLAFSKFRSFTILCNNWLLCNNTISCFQRPPMMPPPGMPPGMPPPNFAMPPPGFMQPPGGQAPANAGAPNVDGAQELWVETKTAEGKVCTKNDAYDN